MDRQTIFAKLRDALAHLYPTTESARRIVDDAGLDARRIRFSAQALENWHAILGTAVQADRVDALLQVVLAEYGTNADLLAAYDSYRTLLEQGGRLEAPPEPLTTDTFYSNVKDFFFGTPEDVIRQRNRHIMLQLVKATWIEGVLEQSLYNAVLIDLHLETRPRAVDYPWDMIIRMPEQADRSFPSGTKIVDVFNQMQQSMLILGEPGSGKTTMLLALGRDLIVRAEADPVLPLPVVFNLSSWAEKRKPLEAWLLDEFNVKYRIPKKVAQAWLDNNELLLLLDGLDEVAQPYRADCVKAINTFRQHHLMAVAVCCRTAEHEALTITMKLQGAVVLKPLTLQQIDVYLTTAGHKLQSVRQMLYRDATLRELAQSPFLLSIMTFAYQAVPVEELRNIASVDERRTHLFDAYITKVFTRTARTFTKFYVKEQTLDRLSWLASYQVQHKQTLFLIEQLQPNWAQTASDKFFVYTAMLMWGPLYGLTAGLIIGLFFGLIEGLSSGLREGMNEMLIGWLIVGLFFGLIFGLGEGLSGRFREIKLSERLSFPWQRLRSIIYTTLLYGLTAGLTFGLFAGLIFGLGEGLSTELFGSWLIGGLIIGLFGGIVGGFREVRLANPFKLSWKRLKSSLAFGLIFGLFGGLFCGLVGLFSGLIGGLIGGLFFGLVGLIGGLIGGLFFEPGVTLEISNSLVTRQPNQTIKLSVKYSIITMLIVGPIVGLVIGLIGWLIVGRDEGLSKVLGGGPIGGLIGGLFFGGVSGGDIVIKHCILRIILWWQGYAPLNYARFLDYCAERIFLRKVGGGYIFVHRLLMEHFASLTKEDIKRLTNNI